MTAVATHTDIFSRILCAVEGSKESLAATLQASRLLAPDGVIELLTVAETCRASQAGWLSTRAAAQIETEAEAALARASDLVPAASTLLSRGYTANVILHTAAVGGTTLVAVGAPRPPRTCERVLGNVADEVVRRADCSVLVARRRPLPMPARIVCGIDGSAHALAAAEVADELGRRLGAEIEFLVGLGGKAVEPNDVGRPARADPRPPVDALVDAALEADLVVVGSRGLHGLRSLGSVSGRVAARCDCSVLIVRR